VEKPLRPDHLRKQRLVVLERRLLVPGLGYAPSVSYVYDGPIYAYNGLTPDQVTVNVQEALAAAGYYNGPVDGVLGPMTREAIANYQADNGLVVTSAIDEPTLATMGLV
jgi:hypothetical protein